MAISTSALRLRLASLARPAGPLLPAMALVAYSHDGVLSRLAAADPLVITAGRFGVAALVLWPLVLARQSAALRGIGPGWLAITCLAGLLLALDFASWIAATKLTSIANSLLLTHVAPVWTVFLSYLLFRKAPTWGEIIAIALSVLGASIITRGSHVSGSEGVLAGDLLAMASSLPAAGFLVLSALVVTRLPMLLYGALAMSWAALFCFAGALLAGSSFVLDGTSLAAILAMALFAQLLGHGGLTWCLHWHSPCFIAIVCLGEPVLGTLCAWAYFDEPVGPWTAVGGAVVLVAIALGCRTGDAPAAVTAPEPSRAP